jgi:periplasmic protein TonB
MRPMDDVAAPAEAAGHEFFVNLNAPQLKERSRRGYYASAAVHVALLLAALAVPFYSHVPMPELQSDPIVAIIYNPGAPPPPPKLLGNVDIPVAERPKSQPAPVNPASDSRLTVPDAVVNNTGSASGNDVSSDIGSPNGSPLGDPLGEDGGILGGEVGGTGDTLGGCIGCTGSGPVTDYEQGPRPIRLTRPQYPQEAFVKKIEGTVTVEIWIDATGKVVHTRVIKSIPQLDLAAIQTVKQWLFAPATKNGRPVAALAHAPVTFRIY